MKLWSRHNQQYPHYPRTTARARSTSSFGGSLVSHGEKRKRRKEGARGTQGVSSSSPSFLHFSLAILQGWVPEIFLLFLLCYSSFYSSLYPSLYPSSILLLFFCYSIFLLFFSFSFSFLFFFFFFWYFEYFSLPWVLESRLHVIKFGKNYSNLQSAWCIRNLKISWQKWKRKRIDDNP